MTSMRPPCLAWVGPWTPVLFLDSLSHAHRCAVAILVCSSPTSGFDSVAGSSAPRHVNLFGPTTLFQATPFSCSFGTADGHEASVVRWKVVVRLKVKEPAKLRLWRRGNNLINLRRNA